MSRWTSLPVWACRSAVPGLDAGGGSGVQRRLRRRCLGDSGLGRALSIGVAGSMVDFLAHGLVDAAYFVIDLAFVHMLSLAT